MSMRGRSDQVVCDCTFVKGYLQRCNWIAVLDVDVDIHVDILLIVISCCLFLVVPGCSWLCENHVRELRTFFTVVLEPNIHTFSVLSETLPDFLKSKLC